LSGSARTLGLTQPTNALQVGSVLFIYFSIEFRLGGETANLVSFNLTDRETLRSVLNFHPLSTGSCRDGDGAQIPDHTRSFDRASIVMNHVTCGNTGHRFTGKVTIEKFEERLEFFPRRAGSASRTLCSDEFVLAECWPPNMLQATRMMSRGLSRSL
jgi:hypothetical protein